MKKYISGDATYFYKYVFPVGLFLLFLYFSLYGFFIHKVPFGTWMSAVLIMIFVWIFSAISFIPLKFIQISNITFIVSNGLKTAEIPFDEVYKIEKISFNSPRIYRIHFRNKTIFGKSVTFTPSEHFRKGSDPAINDLQRLLNYK